MPFASGQGSRESGYAWFVKFFRLDDFFPVLFEPFHNLPMVPFPNIQGSLVHLLVVWEQANFAI